jgi:DNA repair exonuclease SbcCD ATPase subunit
MTPAGVVFDANSGISEEEQREILAAINGIAESNRRSLSEAGGAAAARRFRAKKSGGLFPLLVNAGAIALLAGGFFLLSSFQGKTDAQVREGAMVYNSAERALIDEIRKETASRIEAKENEISRIVSQLEGVDAELQGLHSSNQELTVEQRAAEQRLTALQDEYRAQLAAARDERSRILEDSRAREANLRAQLEARTRDLAVVAEQSATAVEIARAELERLSAEQGKAADVEAQLGGYFITLNDQIRANQLTAAAETLAAMRQFLDTPAFQSLRSIQARKELYAQTINSLEGMVEQSWNNQAALALAAVGRLPDAESEKAIAELREANSRLEETLTEKDKTIAAFSSQGSGLNQRLAKLESDAAGLRAEKSALERQSAGLQSRYSDLQAQNSELQAAAAQRNQELSTLQSSNTSLTQTVTTRDNEIRQLNSRITTLTSLNESLQKSNNELTSLIQQQGQQPPQAQDN